MTCCLLACVPPPNNSCWSSAACCARSSTCVSVCVSHFLQDRDERRLKICLHTMAGHSLNGPPLHDTQALVLVSPSHRHHRRHNAVCAQAPATSRRTHTHVGLVHQARPRRGVSSARLCGTSAGRAQDESGGRRGQGRAREGR